MNVPLPLKHILNESLKSKELFINDHKTSVTFANFPDLLPGFKVVNISHQRISLNIEKDTKTIDSSFPPENVSDEQLLNFSQIFLEGALWPSLQPENWQMEAVKLLKQPEYIVMLVLCCLALTMNITSIIAIFHVPQRLTTHLKLIISLGIADIMIIISLLLHIVNKLFNSMMEFGITVPSERLHSACVSAAINSISIFSFLVSLLNLLAMAIDHYIGIIKPLCYYRLMSRNKAYIIIILLWMIAAIGGFSNFLLGFVGYKSKQTLFNYCEYIMYDNFNAEYLVFGVTLLCLFVIIYIYLRIYYEVKKIQTRTPSFPDETLQNKKAMFTTLLIIGTFSVCWLPNCIFQIYMIAKVHFNSDRVHELFSTYLLISKYLYILMLTNCFFDPIIYAVRLNIVQKGYKNVLQKILRKFHAVRGYKCFRTCKTGTLCRRSTLNSEQEMTTLLRQRPSIITDTVRLASINFDSADSKDLFKESAHDLNGNQEFLKGSASEFNGNQNLSNTSTSDVQGYQETFRASIRDINGNQDTLKGSANQLNQNQSSSEISANDFSRNLKLLQTSDTDINGSQEYVKSSAGCFKGHHEFLQISASDVNGHLELSQASADGCHGNHSKAPIACPAVALHKQDLVEIRETVI